VCTFSWNVNRRFFTIFISQREPVITVCELLWVEVCLIILTLVFSFNRSYFGFVIPILVQLFPQEILTNPSPALRLKCQPKNIFETSTPLEIHTPGRCAPAVWNRDAGGILLRGERSPRASLSRIMWCAISVEQRVSERAPRTHPHIHTHVSSPHDLTPAEAIKKNRCGRGGVPDTNFGLFELSVIWKFEYFLLLYLAI